VDQFATYIIQPKMIFFPNCRRMRTWPWEWQRR